MILGAHESFRPGEYDRVERTVRQMRDLGLTHLRTVISWADADRSANESWFQWLIPHLAQHLDVVPCFVGTPARAGAAVHPATPPSEPQAYGELLEAFVDAQGDHFDWVEVWDEPNAPDRWDRRLDPDHQVFAHLATDAARRMHEHDKKVVLGGMDPIDGPWLEALDEHGALRVFDAIAVHAFPTAPRAAWAGWAEELAHLRAVLDARGARMPIWVTATGHGDTSDGTGQLALAQDVLDLDVARAYWHRVEDLPDTDATTDRMWRATGLAPGEPQLHYGLHRADGSPRALALLLAAGRDPRDLRWIVQEEALGAGPDHIVITGGAGFVGTNLAHRLLQDGQRVLVYDDLSRKGSLENLEWLRAMHGNALRVRLADVRDPAALHRAVRGARAVFHLAAQTAVTTSLQDPRSDFEVNAEGTFNVLEAVRHEAPDAFLLYASTNKVYGDNETEALVERDTAWRPRRTRRTRGADGANRPLSFVTPYGCSKGAADQYVIDHARTFGLHATVFRMSCIYGPHQNGTADQGWLSHFLHSARRGASLTIYGDGKQVRDVLHVDDLVEAYVRAMAAPEVVSGRAFDIGGGPRNAISLLELLDIMDDIGCPRPPIAYDAARPGDQRYYVSDIGPLRDALNWEPKTNARDGIERLWRGVTDPTRVEVTA